MLLANFHSIRPPFESSQKETLDWLVDAHTQSESIKGLSPEELALFKEALREKLWHVGCKPDRIGKRGHVLADFLHRDWDKMEIYKLGEFPKGKDLSFRAKVFDTEVDKIFEAYYPDTTSPPDDLIHVSCTGYVSPSGAQKITSKRGWGKKTTVTHAYHMGCYGSIPALRMASGFRKKRTDIVHTEICSLHSNPSKHETDQLVSQSLFADGFIKYSCFKKTDLPHLKVLNIQEEIIPNSIKAMTWNVVDWGFQMTLAKEIPVLIARHLVSFLERLLEGKDFSKALFAIHPGGPKILLHIQDLLKLSDSQMTYSFKILKQYGNMSSATLPHIWEEILKDAPDKTPIVSLAFGPGLSIAGSLMEKSCGS
jgi:predicted naringenin-chalcone synthase